MRPLIFWFEFASTYSYLSAMRIEDLARDAGVPLIWRPFLLGPIFASQGWQTSPFNIYPAKGRYMQRDLERLAAAQGLPPYRHPEVFPQNGLLAARVAQLALKKPRGPAFCRAVYQAQFADGAMISEPETLLRCLEIAGLPAELLDAAADAENKAELRQMTEAAAEAGLFGAPSFTVGDELFWGDDRLEAALAFAQNAPEPQEADHG